jgi:hypothetical protein
MRKEKSAIEEKNKQFSLLKADQSEDLLKAKNALVKEQTIYVEKRPNQLVTLLPFGINHFVLESPIKGGIHLSLQALGLATNIGGYWWKQSYLRGFGSRELLDSTDKNKFETAQITQYVGILAMVLSFGVSIVDALFVYKSLPAETRTAP